MSTPEARLLQEESVEVGRQILQQALAELEPHHRLVLRLVYWDGLTLREAGHVMGLDFTTVSRRLKNARLALHSLLKRVSRRGFDLPAEALPDVLLPAGGSGNGVAQEPPLDGES